MFGIVFVLCLFLCIGNLFGKELRQTPASGKAPAVSEKIDDSWKKVKFSAEDLKKYNGKNGMPVYAAVDGIVYDLSKVKPWKGGTHMQMHDAGTDQTYNFNNKAPKHIHKDRHVLDKLPKVGVLVQSASEKKK